MKNLISHSPLLPTLSEIGVVIEIFSPRSALSCCATGAVIAIFESA
jgi:hypothetical protein